MSTASSRRSASKRAARDRRKTWRVWPAIERAYGVDRHVLVAIWGIESNYGQAQGERSVIRSLATLTLEDPKRPGFWKTELLAALRILEQGDVTPTALTGSWAGAMGHTQFMPTSYQRLAVDFDGNGKRDIWGTPADALASTANYLQRSGWIAAIAPVVEVTLPPDFDFSLAQLTTLQTPETWRQAGLRGVDGAPLASSDANRRLLLPAGARGPAFLASVNFSAILKYNSSVAYALAVAHLADRLRGASPFTAAWPIERALSRSEREELQSRLVERGMDVGGVDGTIGSLTRTAIRSYQKDSGMVPDGHPDLDLLDRLRSSKSRGSE